VSCEKHIEYNPFKDGVPNPHPPHNLDCWCCWQTYVEWQNGIIDNLRNYGGEQNILVIRLLKAANISFDLLSRIQDEIPIDAVTHALAKAIEKAEEE